MSQPTNVGLPFTNGSGVRTEHSGNQTVHVRENSDSTLDQLFEVVKNSGPNKQSDWTKRNLPTSFFTQPQVSRHITGNHEHNRNSSQDSTQFATGILPNTGLQPPVQHMRSRSAPVSLSPSMSLPPQLPVHTKQQSVDIVEDVGGWNPNSIQQYEFSSGSQAWMGTPNKTGSASALNQSPSPGTLSPNSHPSLSPASSLQSVIGPLPQGWEMSITPEGEIYYINHIDKSTSWFHPTMSNKGQQGPLKLSQLHPTQQLIIQRHITQQQALAAAAAAQQQVSQQPQQGALPPQMVSPIQRTGAVLASPQAGGGASGGQGPNVGGASSSANQQQVNETYIIKELQKLQMQKKQLQRQQEEISKRESQLALLTKSPEHTSSTQQPTAPGMGEVPTQQQQQQPPSSAIQSTDPFLGQAHSNADSHARQNSADSGLGMGTGYSLPRTPEDFLSNVDEMDSSETGHKIQKGQGSDFNMNEMEGLGMDVGMNSSMDTHSTPMDEHELVPTLQEDIGSDLLEGMEGQKIENLLTWL